MNIFVTQKAGAKLGLALFGVVFATLLGARAAPPNALLEFTNGDVKSFSTKLHAKAKGANFSLKYPKSWTSKDGERPNIVQKFTSANAEGTVIMAISTRSLVSETGVRPSAADLKKLLSPDELKNLIPANSVLIEAKATKIDGEAAGMTRFSMQQENAGMSIDMHAVVFSFVDGDTFVELLCGVASLPKPVAGDRSEATQAQRMADYLPLFMLIANSIVVEGRWK